MNQKIPFHELSARIALATGIGAESAELFVKNFFDLLSEALTSGESVRIKGLGAFNVIEKDGERNIEFLPDKEINDTINAPFAMFEAVSLSDDLSDEMLVEVENEVKIETETHATDDELKSSRISKHTAIIERERPTDGDETPDGSDETPDDSTADAEADSETIHPENGKDSSTESESEPEESPEQAIVEEPSAITGSSEADQTISETEIAENESTESVEVNSDQSAILDKEAETTPEIEEIVEEIQPVREIDEPIATGSINAQPQSTPIPPAASQPPMPEEPVQPLVSKAVTQEPVQTPEPTPIVKDEHARTITPPTRPVAELEEDEEEYVTPSTNKSNGGGNFWIGLIVGLIVGLALGACGVYLAIDKIFPTMHQSSVFNEENSAETDELFDAIMSDSVSDAESVPADTIGETPSESTVAAQPEPAQEEQPKQAEAAPVTASTNATVTDTIRRGYLIHDMAKKHYGNKDFWVYIYEENKSKIGNPNNMQAGVVLVIPPAEKYGISANDPESLRKARAKSGEVLRKFSR